MTAEELPPTTAYGDLADAVDDEPSEWDGVTQPRLERVAYLADDNAPEPKLASIGPWEGEGPPPTIEGRVWRHGDNSQPWPDITPDMFYGPLGRFALEAAQHTEASPVAIYAHALSYVGCLIGRGPHLMVSNTMHPCVLFSLICGESARARKGTSAAPVELLIRRLDPKFCDRQMMSAFGSGEALIEALDPRDASASDPKKMKKDYDHRVLLTESEFGGLLARSRREGNTVSATLRDAWDGKALQRRIVGSVTKVRDYHLTVVGHITVPELKAKLGDSEMWGGFANRFMFFLVRAGDPKPRGGNVPHDVINRYAAELAPLISHAQTAGLVGFSDEAWELWDKMYMSMRDDTPAGVLQQIVSRDVNHVQRMALLFALLDGGTTVEPDHLGAAYFTWRYSRASAAHIFGEQLHDPRANKVLGVLRHAEDMGMTTEDVQRATGRNIPRLSEVLEDLQRGGWVASVAVKGTARQGRTPRRWWALRPEGDDEC